MDSMDSKASEGEFSLTRQRSIGLSLALGIIAAWLALHIALVFFWKLSPLTALVAAPLIALQTWLYVGLFIIAHDCMHGSLLPLRPAANRIIGRICLFLYAGFSFDRLCVEHHKHHRHPGTEHDPDFDPRPLHGFWRWFAKFFLHYFGWRQAVTILAVSGVYQLIFLVPPENIALFWALPGILSALQLFTFGTYLPHKPAAEPFADRHNARSNDFPIWLSLITCFHFGLHREHHLFPSTPWWRLPSMRGRWLEERASRTG